MSDHENNYSSDDDSSFEEKPIVHRVVSTQYPLKDTWIMYDHAKSDSQMYEASRRIVSEFNTVVHFWQILNNYPSPSKLFNNGIYRPVMKCKDQTREISSLSVFKKGILPKWEDPKNKYGAEFSKRKFNKKEPLKELDANWIDILVACVGCIMDNSVTGVRVVDSSAPKKNEHTGLSEFKVLYRIELWFENIAKKQVIEEQFKNILAIEDSRAIFYKEHDLAKNE